MKLVTLIRHAKALPPEIGQDDDERALSLSGREAASTIGLELEAVRPALALCSPSKRTRETLDLVSAAWKKPAEIAFRDTLYLADASTLLSCLNELPDVFATVWLVGHNPGLHDLARLMAEWAGREAMKMAFYQHFPPAAYASFRFDTDEWQSLDHSPCYFEAPKRL